MKLLIKLALLGFAAMSQSAWADSGPYYVRLTGFCNAKKVYLNKYNDIYGTEVGCPQLLGQPVVGYLRSDGLAIVSRSLNFAGSSVCMEFYFPDGTESLQCSGGTAVDYSSGATSYTVKPSAISEMSKTTPYVVSTQAPDLESLKDLPAR